MVLVRLNLDYGWMGSNLEELLENKGVKHLYFCGFTTEHCVEMTMNTLKEKGYNCILIRDCTATKNQRLQKKVEKRNLIITSVQKLDSYSRTYP